MVNHFYDEAERRTRCGEHEGDTAFHVSSIDRVSCPECRDLLTPAEREGQWYPYDFEGRPIVTDVVAGTTTNPTAPAPYVTTKAPGRHYPDRFTRRPRTAEQAAQWRAVTGQVFIPTRFHKWGPLTWYWGR